ncbi:carbon-nitrogen hydrolase family protein [uncultured Nocardioides sp.]|uniref:Aliphatic amidase AmiE n=1 Tax=uncultured Nocardioides sp. TaxID=198441 RepID=A0A6J4PH25_9ACTN|nr:carbon-nitrogen hydrolase family protein [uncultured Nocardioides sp.]CAA9413344.1 MAG: Aliphatic amidase AmiE [uncultured Nocardioides sp.]
MSGRLRVTLVQEASTQDPDRNRVRLRELVPGDADLVVLPEAFQRDFGDIDSDLAPFGEDLDGPFGSEVAAVAAERGTTVVAGMFERGGDAGRPFNTLLVRGAAEASYRKIHLYDSFGYRESDRLSAGPVEPVTFALGGFTVGLMTCYDLRFPELARSLVDAGADVLVVPSAWVAGERKVDHWRTLVRARAIENTVYVVAAGQPAPRYCGHSMIVGPLGDVVAEAGPDAAVVRGVLDASAVAEARRTNPSLANRRG